MQITVKEPCGDVIFMTVPSPADPSSGYHGFAQETVVIPKGHKYHPNAAEFPCDVLYERDVAIPMRDGVILYADIYRPTGEVKAPALVSFGCSGKRARWNDIFRQNPPDGGPGNFRFSGYQLYLGSDPVQWVPYGYAVVSVDSRGVYMSEGNIHYPCKQDGQDGYDVVEWIAAQSWCTGKVGLAGHRWAGELVWFTAAECPPHLTAIAPWEAHGDLYEDEFVRGGIPKPKGTGDGRGFSNGLFEDIDAMIEANPCYNTYWDSKNCEFENITVPALVINNYVSLYHTKGTVDGFMRIASKEKWLYFHDHKVFTDYYWEENLAPTREFFDYYLLGKMNGWKNRRRVKLLLMDFDSENYFREEDEYPPSHVKYSTYWLNAETKTLSPTPLTAENTVSYDSSKETSDVSFSMTFSRRTELIGGSKLRLWIQSPDSDDADIYVNLYCIGKDGQIKSQGKNYFGPFARLRASHRALDDARSTELVPVYLHRTEQLLAPGAIVPLDFAIWPAGMVFHPGDSLVLTVKGLDTLTEQPPGIPNGNSKDGDNVFTRRSPSRNKGQHILYTGGKYDAYLTVPLSQG